MSILNRVKATDSAKDKVNAELADPNVGAVDRFRTSTSDLLYRCTFGKYGTQRPEKVDCQFTEEV